MSKKFLSVFLSGMLALSLTACTPTENNSSIVGETPSATATVSVIKAENDVAVTTKNVSASEEATSATISTTETIGSSDVPEDSSFFIHFIDVGQADAALIQCDGEYMLIDGGNVEDSNLIYSVLERDNITNLDIVVGTHAHEDHIGGLSGALSYATADIVLSPVTEVGITKAFDKFKEKAEKQSGGLTVPEVGDTYEVGNAEVEILGINATEDTNESSIILMVTYGETKFLFTGDAEYEAEQAVLATGVDLSCDVLKVGHHGSDSSTSYMWLNAIMPEYAVISVGEGNSYQHPTDAVLSRLRDADVTTYRTDLNGDVFAYSDGKTVTMSVTKEASKADIFTAGSIGNGSTQTTPAYTEVIVDDSNSSVEAGVYILNTNSMKFHEETCSSAAKISEQNREEYAGTRENLIEQGYSPCGYCKP